MSVSVHHILHSDEDCKCEKCKSTEDLSYNCDGDLLCSECLFMEFVDETCLGEPFSEEE